MPAILKTYNNTPKALTGECNIGLVLWCFLFRTTLTPATHGIAEGFAPQRLLGLEVDNSVLTLNSGDDELLKLVREQGQLREESCLSTLPTATAPAFAAVTTLEEEQQGKEREQELQLPEEEDDIGVGVNYEKAVQLMTVGSMHLPIDVAHQCPKLTVHFSLL